MKSDLRKRPAWPFVTTWYVSSVAAVLLFAAYKYGFPPWRLPRPQLLAFACLTAAFILSAGSAVLLRPRLRGAPLGPVVVCTMAIFGTAFLGLFLMKSDLPRSLTLVVFVSGLMLVPAPFVVGDTWLGQAIAFAALLAIAVGGGFGLRVMPTILAHTSSVMNSELYNLSVDSYPDAFPKSAVRGGALAQIGDRYLLMTGDGHLHLFHWQAGTDQLAVRTLPYRVPINGDAFSVAAGRPWADRLDGVPQEAERVAAGHEVLNNELFRTYGLLVQEVGPDARIFASHPYWHAGRQCWTERVSMLESSRATILRGGDVSAGWKSLFETTPCLPIQGPQRRRGIPFAGYFGGGRMALLDPDTLLLTVGDFGFDGLASVHAYAQDPAASYGKTIAIDIADGRATTFTLGHRNPEGLSIDRSGTIWSTEHGPRGGDELNRLVRGANYGWPYATDGTDYGSFTWPLNKPEAEQSGFTPPVFAWVPSIGISNLLVVRRGLFSKWRGDLLIGSLRAETLFRARLRDGKVEYVEPMFIGKRIRDIIESRDGRLVLWTDDGTLISLRPMQGTTGEALFDEKCSGCHQSSLTSGNRIGPELLGVVGRRVASIESYPDYSPALRRIGGSWTEARLNRFLQSPDTFCPGTRMDFAGDASATERAAIIGYLRTLQ